MGSTVKKVASFALPIIGGVVGGPVGAAVGGAAAGAIGGGGLKGALIGGATGYAGNALGSTLGSTLTKGLGSIGGETLGSATGGAANVLGDTVANTTIGQSLGNYAGNSIAGSVAGSLFPQKPNSINAPAMSGPAPFHASQQSPMALPASLSTLGSLTPSQQTSNIANQGVYGSGQGPQEDAYFLNQINRRLVDQSGHVAGDLSSVSPIENSFLAKLGLGGQSNPTSLLQAISKWQAA